MGAISELDMDINNGDVDPFILEGSNPETTRFFDGTKQQAEAETAPALPLHLIEQSEEIPSDEDEPEDEVPVAPELSPAQKKKEHEDKEALRKAEWDNAQAAKQEEEMFAWENAVCVSDEELVKASTSRIGTDSERLTRRNMKVCVTEYIQTKCLVDMNFARQTLYPRKNMINCFRYINRKAKEFIEQEMKDNGEKPTNDGYGYDVPDDLCYKWAEEYFLDMDADEDKADDEKFVAKSYNGPSVPKAKKPAKKAEKKVAPKQEEVAEMMQTSLMEQASILVQHAMASPVSLVGGIAV